LIGRGVFRPARRREGAEKRRHAEGSAPYERGEFGTVCVV